MAKKTSEKQIRANRENAKKSTGPKTAEGKEASKRNAVKHGLSGNGKIAPADVEREMKQRAEEWTSVMKPAQGPEAWLVGRAAALSARVDAAVRCEGERRGRLGQETEKGHFAKAVAEKLGKELERRRNPEPIVARLETTVAGCDWMIERWNELEERRREAEGVWSRDDLVMAMKLTGNRLSDLGSDDAMFQLACHYCAARGESRADYLIIQRLKFAHAVRGFHPDRKTEFEVPATGEQARQALGDHAARQLKSLRIRRRRLAAMEAAAPPTADTIDLSEDGDRLRRYEISLDRQLHNALRRLESLRIERSEGAANCDQDSLRNEATSPDMPTAPISLSPRNQVAGRPDEGLRFEPDADPLIRRGAAVSPEGAGKFGVEMPLRNEAVSEDRPRQETFGAYGRHRRIEETRSVGTSEIALRNEPVLIDRPADQPIAPRRSRVAGLDQPVAKVVQDGPPLRGKVAGKDEGRGRYCSPEATRAGKSEPENPYRDRFPRSRIGFSGRGLPLQGEQRSPIVERPDDCGGRGEPGGTRAMVACEPGQDGNGAAISIASMCPGAPPRLSQAPASSHHLRPRTDGA